MLNKTVLHEYINNPNLSQRNSVFLILYCEANVSKSITEIKKIGKEAGLWEIEKWNIADILGKAKGLSCKINGGWVLTKKGKEYVSNLVGVKNKRPALKSVADDLRVLIEKLQNTDTRLFLEEALSCFEIGSYRAAVVLSWAGAIHILYEYVFYNKLLDFNVEAKRRDIKWKDVKAIDDLGRMKERNFIDILATLSVVGKNLKKELENCLDLRNGCGHPNSFKIGENRAAAHLETLVNNIYSKF